MISTHLFGDFSPPDNFRIPSLWCLESVKRNTSLSVALFKTSSPRPVPFFLTLHSSMQNDSIHENLDIDSPRQPIGQRGGRGRLWLAERHVNHNSRRLLRWDRLRPGDRSPRVWSRDVWGGSPSSCVMMMMVWEWSFLSLCKRDRRLKHKYFSCVQSDTGKYFISRNANVVFETRSDPITRINAFVYTVRQLHIKIK